MTDLWMRLSLEEGEIVEGCEKNDGDGGIDGDDDKNQDDKDGVDDSIGKKKKSEKKKRPLWDHMMQIIKLHPVL